MDKTDILVASNMTMKFGGLLAVDNVTINLKTNEILGLIGANGAGKTTLFNMISGVIKSTSGVIYYKQKPIKNPYSHRMCNMGIGRTYQICQPFMSLTVLENIMVGAFLRNQSIKHARDKAGKILELVELGHRHDVRGQDLNLTELKRLELARALATDPEVLLLDEVMAGLNPTECQKLINLIKNIRSNGVSIIVIEHVMRAIMTLSDRIYVLNQGKLIAEGSPKEVSNNEAVIKSYLGEKRYA